MVRPVLDPSLLPSAHLLLAVLDILVSSCPSRPASYFPPLYDLRRHLEVHYLFDYGWVGKDLFHVSLQVSPLDLRHRFVPQLILL